MIRHQVLPLLVAAWLLPIMSADADCDALDPAANDRFTAAETALSSADQRAGEALGRYAWAYLLSLGPEADAANVTRHYLAALRACPDSALILGDLLSHWTENSTEPPDERIIDNLGDLARAYPAAVDLNLVVANAHLRQRDFQAAEQLLKRLFKAVGWDEPRVVKELVILYLHSNRISTAHRLLSRAASPKRLGGSFLYEQTAALFYQTVSADQTRCLSRRRRRSYRRLAFEHAFRAVASVVHPVRGDDATGVAEMLLRAGFPADACRLLTAVRNDGNASPDSERLRAACLEQLDRWSEALSAWQELAEESPFEPEYYLHAARIHARRGERLKALTDLEKTYRLTLDPRIADQVLKLAAQLNRPDKVVEYADRAPTTTDTLMLKALALHMQHQPAKTLDALLAVERLVGDDAAERQRVLNARYYTLLGSAQYSLRQYTAAAKALATAVERAPGSDEARLLLAATYEKQGDIDRCFALARTVLRESPDNAAAALALARLFRRRGDIDEALAHYTQTLALRRSREVVIEAAAYGLGNGHPEMALATLETIAEDIPTGMLRAHALYRLKRWNKAFQVLDRIARMTPPNDTIKFPDADYYLLRGAVCRAIDRPGAAVDAFLKATHLAADNLSAKRALATAYEENADLEAAARTWQEIAAVQPKLLIAHYRLARVRRRLRQFDAALAAYHRAFDLEPSPALAVEIAGCYLGAGRPLAALEYARQGAGDYRALMVQAYALRGLGRNAEAVAAMEKAAAAAPPKANLDAHYYLLLASAYHELDDATHTIDTLETAIRLHPDSHELKNFLGYYLADRDEQLGRAEQLILAAVKAQPDNAAYEDSRAWVYYRQGRLEPAARAISRALELQGDRSDATILDHAGDIYRALGREEEAVGFWRRAIEHEPEQSADIRKKLDGSRTPAGTNPMESNP